jgi:diguanylate cyclase (GGDEF)-like protein
MFKIHFDSELIKVKHSKQLFDLANYDALTSLSNRHSFNNKLIHSLKAAARNKSQVGILFLDLDGFKTINDTLGHNIGDLVLKLSANKIKVTVREIDTVGRLGGDEFAIILEDIEGISLCETIMERLKFSVASITEIDTHKITLGTSIGYSVYPKDGKSADELLNLADKRMYIDKNYKKQAS